MKSSVTESESDDNTLQGFSLNHNETVVGEDETGTGRLADLLVNDEQSSEIIGGLLVPAVQKVREAAAR